MAAQLANEQVVGHLGRVAIMIVGLTGGVGSGKSTVAAMFAEHGAVIVDADKIAREVVEPGTPGLAAVVAAFGPDVLTADGALDRPKLAGIVFDDDAARTRLNEIVHPLIGERSAQLAAVAPPNSIVIYDVPLLVEGNVVRAYQMVIVVEAPRELRLQRLAGRGMDRPQAEARMAAQASDEQRRAVADEVIVNDGPLDDLRRAVDEVWERVLGRAAQLS
jgi:dephospho-CoA kinase